jgi:hypothetical protein
MKNWINKNYKTLIITAFLIPIITVAIVSISHVTQWYGISNPVTWSIYLSIGIEIAALSALAAISANMGSKVYFPFAIVTIIQFIGNIFFAYSYIDIDGKGFRDWVDLTSPLVEFMGVEPTDFVGHKRFLAFFAGGMLPVISLSFLHMLVKFTEEDRKKQNVITEEKPNSETPINASDIIGEVSRVRLSEADLKILEDALLNPSEPNEKLKEAAEKYKETQKEALIEMMKNDEELGLYDEPFDNPMVKEPSVTPQNAEEMMLTTNNDIIESIPSDDEVSDWDETLMDGLEDEEPFFTEEEIENILQEEPTEREIEQNFSTIEPETENIFQEEYVPSLSDEEIMEMNQNEYERILDNDEFDGFVPEPFAVQEEPNQFDIDVEKINNTLDIANQVIDNQIEDDPIIKFNVEIVNDEPIYQSEQKEMDEANQILEDVEPEVQMFIQEPVQVENPITSEDEDLKKKP